MKILLGNFNKWRINRFIFITIIMGITIIILRISNIRKVSLNALILFVVLISAGLIMDSKLFKKIYVTECSEINGYIYIKNKKIDYKICKSDIKNIYYKDVFYGGKFLKIIGYKLIIECKNNKYVFDSIYNENSKWEESDLYKLKNMLIE